MINDTDNSENTASERIDYNELREELSEVLARLEQGDVGIDEAVANYDRGLQIIATLEKQLLHAQNRVHELRTAATDDGNANNKD